MIDRIADRRQLTRREFLRLTVAACAALVCGKDANADGQGSAAITVAYKDFQGDVLELTPWIGRNVVVCSARSDLDPALMSRIVKTFDTVYDYYNGVTGRTPAPAKIYNGHLMISEVPKTCGAGCSYIGSTGIEIQTTYFELLYNTLRDTNQYDQVAFYEFGRNFWFYTDQIEYIGADNAGGIITTGYAVFMRFESMANAGVGGAPFNGIPFDRFRSAVGQLIDTYEADRSLTWQNTLRAGKAPPNSMGLGGTDMFASYCLRLARDYGGDTFVHKLWPAVGLRPKPRRPPTHSITS